MPIFVGLESSEARLVGVGGQAGQVHAFEDGRVGERLFEGRHALPAGAGDLEAEPGVEQVGLVVDQRRADPDDRRPLRPCRASPGSCRRQHGVDHVAPGVSDQAGVDPELAAERHEQPGALGPDGPFGLGGHAADQDVVRPGEGRPEPPGPE